MPRIIDPVVRLRYMLRHKTQAELAERLGVSQGNISDVLTGRREPTPKLLEAMGLRRVVKYERIDDES